jgi:hypothetical protein
MGNVQKIRWGILACGRIARKFADDLKHVEGAELVAVASRDLERAKVFAESFPAKHVLFSMDGQCGFPKEGDQFLSVHRDSDGFFAVAGRALSLENASCNKTSSA